MIVCIHLLSTAHRWMQTNPSRYIYGCTFMYRYKVLSIFDSQLSAAKSISPHAGFTRPPIKKENWPIIPEIYIHARTLARTSANISILGDDEGTEKSLSALMHCKHSQCFALKNEDPVRITDAFRRALPLSSIIQALVYYNEQWYWKLKQTNYMYIEFKTGLPMTGLLHWRW